MLPELIDQFYLEQNSHKDRTKFYISDAGKCQRSIFFKFKNVPEKTLDPQLLRMFEHGDLLHRNIFSVLYRLKIGVTTEVSIPAQEIVSGRADALLTIDGQNYVLDIKSINGILFSKMTGPKIENVYQLQLYMHFFNIDKGILLYIDKNFQKFKEFIIDYNKDICENLVKNFEELDKKVKSEIVPDVVPNFPSDWQCKYCAFKQLCKLAGKEELSWLDFKKKVAEAPDNGVLL